MIKNLLFLCLFFLFSCAGVVLPSKKFPMYLTQENGNYYIQIILDHIPTYSFLIDDQEINHDFIKYQKTDFGHVIKVPVKEDQQDFKIKTSLTTLAHKKISLKYNPQKLMLIASYSRPLLKAITTENPDVLVVFSPPETLYYSEKDFLDNPIFNLDILRSLYIVGHKSLQSSISSELFTMGDLERSHFLDRPTILTHYLPFLHTQSEEQFNHLAQRLKRNEQPVIFLSSYPSNLIQQIPRGQLGFPTYEFSVKNHFLALPHDSTSPWEMIADRRADYLTLDLKFSDSYWHILLMGKDDNQDLVFSRDLTLYQTKIKDGRDRRNAR